MLLLLYLEVPNVLFAGTFWTSENEHVMGARFSKLKRLDPSRNRTLVLSHPKNPFKSLDQSLLTFRTLSGRRRLPLHRGWSSSLSTGPTAFLLRSLSSSPYTIHSSLLHNTTNTKKKNTNKTLNDPGMLQPSRSETLPVAHRAFSVTPDLARV
jgi:hypothetical protein